MSTAHTHDKLYISVVMCPTNIPKIAPIFTELFHDKIIIPLFFPENYIPKSFTIPGHIGNCEAPIIKNPKIATYPYIINETSRYRTETIVLKMTDMSNPKHK